MIHRFFAAAAFLTALALEPVPVFAHDHLHHDAQVDASGKPSDRSIYNLDSRWTTQDGETVPLGSLTGKPAIAAMGYTTCKDMCPAIVADMMWVEKHLPPGAAARVRFAFFSFDSAVDTPAKLKAYADDHGFDTQRWTLFHGDEDAVRELAAALGAGYRPDGQGGFDNAAVISLLDANGEVVFQQRGAKANSEELLDKLKELL
jgi:protein SCO1